MSEVIEMKRRPGRPRRYASVAERSAAERQRSKRRAAYAAAPDVVIGSKPRYSLKEAAYLLGIRDWLLRRRINAGQIATVIDGRRVFITDEELRRYASVSTQEIAPVAPSDPPS